MYSLLNRALLAGDTPGPVDGGVSVQVDEP